MKEKQDKWVENLRIRMNDFSEPPSEGLWNRIEKDLSVPRVVPFWRTRRFAIAAAVTTVAVSSVSVWLMTSFLQNTVEGDMRSIAKEIVVPSGSSFMNDTKLADRGDVGLDKDMQHPKSKLPATHRNEPETIQALLSSIQTESSENRIEPNDEKEISDAALSSVSEKEEKNSVAEHKAWRKQVEENRRRMKQNHQNLVEGGKPDKHSSWSLGVSAGNMPSSSASMSETDYLLSRTSMSGALLMASSPTVSSPSDNWTEKHEAEKKTEVNHKIPVSVGASVRWNINDLWAVESGLCYTYLSSEIHNLSNPEIEEKQNLHYLGIPIKLQRMLWKNRRFSVYASAGAMFEKCIKATRDISYSNGVSAYDVDNIISSAMGGIPATSGIPVISGASPVIPKVDGESSMEYSSAAFQGSEHSSFHVNQLQCSVSASVGAQFDLTKYMGLYMEPGVTYYFNDGSGIETIRKEHPFNFSFQLGIRFTVSK